MKDLSVMKAEAEQSLIKCGYVLKDNIWRGKYYNAVVTDELQEPNPITKVPEGVVIKFKKNDSW